MFWPVTSPSDFHKTSENPNCLIKEDQRNNNIFKWHASNGPNVERNFTSKGDLDFCVTKFRFCDKFEKGTTDISVENRVFGVSDNFNKHDVSLTSGYPKQMHATYSVTKDHNYGINQTPRETLVHCPGSASRENSVQVLATTTNSGSERSKFLSNQSKIKPAVTDRVEVVEGEFTSSERQTTENRNTTVNNPNGCFQNRLEARVLWYHHRGNLVISGKDKTYQYTGAHCSETCNIDFYQGQIRNNNPLTNRQYDSSVLLGKNGENSQSRTATSSQGNMGLSVSQWNSSYSRVLTKQSEYSGRLAI